MFTVKDNGREIIPHDFTPVEMILSMEDMDESSPAQYLDRFREAGHVHKIRERLRHITADYIVHAYSFKWS